MVMGKSLASSENRIITKVEKLSDKCPEIVRKLAKTPAKTNYCNFRTLFGLFGQCFYLVTLSNVCGITTLLLNKEVINMT